MTSQRLGLVPSVFMIEHHPQATFPEDDEWIALVRAPEGLTVIREAPPWFEGERWIGLYGASHGIETPGMLAAILTPLAAAGISVFVASTFHADLVLVPEHLRDAAVSVLTDAGHKVST